MCYTSRRERHGDELVLNVLRGLEVRLAGNIFTMLHWNDTVRRGHGAGIR